MKIGFKRMVIYLLAGVLSLSLVLSLAFFHGGVTAGAEDSEAWSNEQYYRMLYLNGLEDANEKSFAMKELDFSHYDEITYVRQGANTWSYLSIGLNVASIALSLHPATNALKLGKLLTIGAKVGSNWALRESIMERIGTADAEMLTQMLTQVMGQISEDFSKLSEKIDAQTNDLKNAIQSATTILYDKIDMVAYKDALNEFFDSDFSGGANGYYEWTDMLRMYFNNLSSPSSPENEKTYYDKLYTYAKGESKLYNDMMGGQHIADDSILEVLYNYCLLASRQSISGFDANDMFYHCIEFGEELLNSFLYANMCLQFAYAHQLMHMNGDVYYLNDGNSVARSVIEAYFLALPDRLSALESELARFYVRVLNLDGVYTADVQDMQGRVSYYQLAASPMVGSKRITIATGATPHYVAKHDHVSRGSVIHLESIPEVLTLPMAGEFTFESSEPSLATVTSNGVVTVVGESGSFSVSLKRDKDVIYTMDFVIGDEAFSGGYGTEDIPYFIASRDDFVKLSSESQYWLPEYHFILTDTIDFKNGSCSPIGNSSTPFAGTFDGNAAKNCSIQNKTQEPLFGTVTGTVKNLTARKIEVSRYDQSVNNYNGGILCIENRGTIDNCRIENSKVAATLYAAYASGNTGYTTYYMRFGAIGLNYGTVQNCTVQGNTVSIVFNSYVDGNHFYTNPSCFVGALVGRMESDSVVRDCLAADCTVYAHLQNISNVGEWNSNKFESTAYFYLGGLTGAILRSASMERCIARSNDISYDWSHYVTDTSGIFPGSAEVYKEEHKGDFWGALNGTASDCYDNLSGVSGEVRQEFADNGWDVSDQGNPTLLYGAREEENRVDLLSLQLPTKRHYSIGEQLNLAGLSVLSQGGDTLYAYTIDAPDLSEKGEKQITVRWHDLTAYFTVTVDCPHTGVHEEEVTVKSDCTFTFKQIKHICDTCGEQVAFTTQLDGFGEHSFGDGVITQPPSYDSDGIKTFTCDKCGATRTESIPRLIRHAVSLSGGAVIQGKTIEVEVSITGNPDIYSASLKIAFDSAALELVSAQDTKLLAGGAFSPNMGTSTYYLNWENTANISNDQNGVIARLTFRAKKDFSGNTDITVSAADGVLDRQMQTVEFEYDSALIDVKPLLKGDVNADGDVNASDVLYLKRYLAGWQANSEIETDAADVNGDGQINMQDLAILRRYLAEWEGVTL